MLRVAIVALPLLKRQLGKNAVANAILSRAMLESEGVKTVGETIETNQTMECVESTDLVEGLVWFERMGNRLRQTHFGCPLAIYCNDAIRCENINGQ